ncbi:MAG: hypothetical protein NXH75_12885, partial [Halobacteriovoraceae bacterium]|nr:hypothetical protein [Halobacteriovoraceae bacterium]
EFSRIHCRPGTEEKFWKHFRAFRGDGHYLPRTIAGKLDKKILNRYIPELQNKKKWIKGQVKELKKVRSFENLIVELDILETKVDELVKLKELYEESTSDTEKISLKNNSKYKMIDFKTRFLKFLKKVPFLTTYRFPVDHFELRENYDEVKNHQSEKSRSRANEVYFYRKIVQDGAQNPNRSHSDTFLRAMLDTISLSMKEDPDFIPENLRYDLYSSFYGLKKQLRRGPKGQRSRFNEWYERVERMVDYYISLRKNKVKRGTSFETGDHIIEVQAKARKGLKEFVYKKQGEVYEYWAEKEEIYQALYAIITILFNEVGSIDSPHALERHDVTQVVINRLTNPKYNFIPKSDSIYEFLDTKKATVKSNPWLNVLFKEGEFSFTYYFIHGAVRVFCPDQTGIGKRLRKRNLKIALKMIEEPNSSFPGVRYFSRASMLGRITMDKIWSDYRPIPEKPGVEVRNSAPVLKAYGKGDYKYRYHFIDDKGRKFKVIEVDDEVYSLDIERNKLFSYRNPHFFRYFEPK